MCWNDVQHVYSSNSCTEILQPEVELHSDDSDTHAAYALIQEHF